MAYSSYIKITVDNSGLTETLTDFPHLINLSTDCGVTSTNISSLSLFSTLGDSNKLKLKLLDEADIEHYVEIETWDSANNKAVLHTKITRTVGVDNVLKLWYPGDPSTESDNSTYIGVTGSTAAQNVWNANFKAVYTMSQDPATGGACILDSTSNANHGTPYGSMASANLVDGLISKSITFDGSDDYITAPVASIATSGTLEILYCKAATNSIDAILSQNTGSTTNTSILLRNLATSNTMYMQISGTAQESWLSPATISPSFVIDEFRYVGFTLDTTVGKSYFDGLVGQSMTPIGCSYTIGSGALNIGRDSRNQDYLAGKIEHIRVSFIARSDAWIKATNLSLQDESNTIEFPSYYVAGSVKIGTTAVETTVRAEKLNGIELGNTVSSSTDGSFTITGLENISANEEIQVVIHTPDSSEYNDLIFRVNPVLEG